MEISVPTVIVDKQIVLNNIKKMVEKAKRNDVVLRPHFKTHQSVEVGKWFKDFGIECITVSSVRMAKCFADAGWKDITIAFPVNVLEIKEINTLAKRIKLNLLVNNRNSIMFLQQSLETQTDIWIKVDVGNHRAGILWNNSQEIIELAKVIVDSANLRFAGILVHSGNSYKSKNNSEILATHKEALERISTLKEQLTQVGFDQVKVSIGDTPTASIAEDFSGVDEIRPGNFVYYDLKQLQVSSCTEEDIAIRVACPVVSKNEERSELIIYGGAIHFSKDITLDDKGNYIFGYLTEEIDGKWGPIDRESYISSLSQEHGVVKTSKNHFERINVGDTILIVPVHSCLTINIMKKFKLTTGEEFDALCS